MKAKSLINPLILIVLGCGKLQATVTVTNNAVVPVASTPSNGDLSITGNLSVTNWGLFTQGIQLGATQDSIISYSPAVKTTTFDIVASQGIFTWRDSIQSTAPLAKNKMTLNAANALTLYKVDTSTGTSSIVLAPATGRITLPAGTGSSTGSGIYFGTNTTATLGAASNGAAVFPGQVTLQSGLQSNGNLSTSSTTPSSSSSTGALTVAGGLGVAMDSWINGVRIGRGNGNVGSNTAAGGNALQSNTTGSYNTAAGNYSLHLNTTGLFNTASGCSSLYYNTTGYHNTASGYGSLSSNNTGYHNTASGSLSLCANATGRYNTTAGSYSLYSNTSGDGNTAFGMQAGYGNSTGTSNIFIGWTAGRSQQDGLTDLNPSGGIYIGAGSRGKDNSDSNAIVIGTGATGEGANTTVIGNDSTLKTHLYGNLEAGPLTVSDSGYLGSETDPLLLLLNGYYAEPSYAITTLKNGQTTLTNKEWKNRDTATVTATEDPPASTTDSGGNALVVDGHTVLNGKVTITVPQGGISMGVYGIN